MRRPQKPFAKLSAAPRCASSPAPVVLAVRNIVRGIDRALRLFAGLRRKHTSAPSLLRTATINGLPGFVSIDRGGVLQTKALVVRDGRIAAIHIVRNPDKLMRVPLG